MMKHLLMPATAILLLASCNSSESTNTNFKQIEVKYPTTKKDTLVKDDYFGTQVADPYRWLEDDISVATGAWVKPKMK
jgi:prolyl oligopeptidase